MGHNLAKENSCFKLLTLPKVIKQQQQTKPQVLSENTLSASVDARS